MCGIAGIISSNQDLVQRERIKKMTDIIAYRGPDGDGQWISKDGRVGLGHRRLSIIDLSESANQPMHYLDRYTIVFNGEIYNYLELKDNLLKHGYQFKTQGDTEVLIALYDKYGVDCLPMLDGMFSFVLYDAVNHKAFCARDRFGEKPFFYSFQEGVHFYFGSEMKTLWEGGVKKEINQTMLFNYLLQGTIENVTDTSVTFYNNCTRLENASYILLDTQKLTLIKQKYYTLEYRNINTNITREEAKAKLHDLFYTSIRRRLRSDVTVGSSLSGGLDSSLIVCVINQLIGDSGQKQDTFSAVFPGYKKDERKYIDYVINSKNVNPNFTTPNEDGLIHDIEKLCFHQEEPFGSSSIYAQYCVMRLAKQNNTIVLLDGQAADEIFGGYHAYYNVYFDELKRTNKAEFDHQWKAYHDLHVNNPINGIATKTLGDKVRSISPSLMAPLRKMRSGWQQAVNPVFNKEFYAENKKQVYDTLGFSFGSLNEALYNNTSVNGLQNLLRYADRNSMANSIEVRLPFLYHELVDFMFTLPANFKINEGWTKWLMRSTFENILPKEIAWRIDKIGYEPPQKNWMEREDVKKTIRDARAKLVDAKVLSPKVLDRVVKAEDASIIKDSSWLHWMAGNLV